MEKSLTSRNLAVYYRIGRPVLPRYKSLVERIVCSKCQIEAVFRIGRICWGNISSNLHRTQTRNHGYKTECYRKHPPVVDGKYDNDSSLRGYQEGTQCRRLRSLSSHASNCDMMTDKCKATKFVKSSFQRRGRGRWRLISLKL